MGKCISKEKEIDVKRNNPRIDEDKIKKIYSTTKEKLSKEQKDKINDIIVKLYDHVYQNKTERYKIIKDLITNYTLSDSHISYILHIIKNKSTLYMYNKPYLFNLIHLLITTQKLNKYHLIQIRNYLEKWLIYENYPFSLEKEVKQMIEESRKIKELLERREQREKILEKNRQNK